MLCGSVCHRATIATMVATIQKRHKDRKIEQKHLVLVDGKAARSTAHPQGLTEPRQLKTTRGSCTMWAEPAIF